MVTVALAARPSTALPVGVPRLMVKLRLPSTLALLSTGTLAVDKPTVIDFAAASPAVQLKLPLFCAVLPALPKSVPATAVPLAVLQPTVTAPVLPPVRVTVNVQLVVCPSVTLHVAGEKFNWPLVDTVLMT